MIKRGRAYEREITGYKKKKDRKVNVKRIKVRVMRRGRARGWESRRAREKEERERK